MPMAAKKQNQSGEELLSPALLFHFLLPCRRTDRSWTAQGVELDESYRIPSFGLLELKAPFADFRLGWSDEGLLFTLRVEGKKQHPWCRDSRLEDSDGLSLWFDTRATHNVHRASKFCHRFVFLPLGHPQRMDQPYAMLHPINRARENPKPAPPSLFRVRSEKRIDGYFLQGWIPAAALTGWDPAEHTKLGFSYAVIDRELGWQTFSLGPEYPFSEDPSLWGTLELMR